MQAKLWRRGIMALTTVGFLLTTVNAQKTPSTSDMTTPTKPAIVERDPFVNQISGHVTVPNFVRPGKKTQDPFSALGSNIESNSSTSDLTDNNLAPEAEKLTAPDLQVAGIVGRPGHRQAILTDGNSTRIVSVGQQLSDFRVSAIGSKSVTVSSSGQDFLIPMFTEF